MDNVVYGHVTYVLLCYYVNTRFMSFSVLVHHSVVKPIVWLDHFMLKDY